MTTSMAKALKPIFFQISPDEFEKRFSELVSNGVKDLVSMPGLGFYRGYPDVLSEKLKFFVDANQNEAPLVIAVSTHGDKDTGNYTDGSLLVSPEVFVKQVAPAFSSLKGKPVLFIFGQCYGATFAMKTKQLFNNAGMNFDAIGFSNSTITETQSKLSISESAENLFIVDVLYRIFSKAVPCSNAKQGAGMGALVQLLSNSNPLNATPKDQEIIASIKEYRTKWNEELDVWGPNHPAFNITVPPKPLYGEK